jgi:hypothetical protein
MVSELPSRTLKSNFLRSLFVVAVVYFFCLPPLLVGLLYFEDTAVDTYENIAPFFFWPVVILTPFVRLLDPDNVRIPVVIAFLIFSVFLSAACYAGVLVLIMEAAKKLRKAR